MNPLALAALIVLTLAIGYYLAKGRHSVAPTPPPCEGAGCPCESGGMYCVYPKRCVNSQCVDPSLGDLLSDAKTASAEFVTALGQYGRILLMYPQQLALLAKRAAEVGAYSAGSGDAAAKLAPLLTRSRAAADAYQARAITFRNAIAALNSGSSTGDYLVGTEGSDIEADLALVTQDYDEIGRLLSAVAAGITPPQYGLWAAQIKQGVELTHGASALFTGGGARLAVPARAMARSGQALYDHFLRA